MDCIDDIFSLGCHELPDPEELALDGGTSLGPNMTDAGSLDEFFRNGSVILREADVIDTASYNREVAVKLHYNDDGTTDVKLTERTFRFNKPPNSKPRRLVETFIYHGKKYLISLEPSFDLLGKPADFTERRLLVTLPSPETRDCRYNDEPNPCIMADLEFAGDATGKLLGQYRTIYMEEMDYTLLEGLIITRLARDA